jgi:hypothetical protein
MNLEDIKDSNGTSLQSYVDTLREKAYEAGMTVLFVFAKREGDSVDLKTVTNIKGDPSSVLLELSNAMAKQPTSTQ